jgi:two-component system sensor histidine kinase YesM
LEPKKEGGIIRINARVKGDFVILEVVDNGIGIEDKIIKAFENREEIFCKNRKHLGLSNTRDRIEIFSETNDSFKIERTVFGGTKIIIKLKTDREITKYV